VRKLQRGPDRAVDTWHAQYASHARSRLQPVCLPRAYCRSMRQASRSLLVLRPPHHPAIGHTCHQYSMIGWWNPHPPALLTRERREVNITASTGPQSVCFSCVVGVVVYCLLPGVSTKLDDSMHPHTKCASKLSVYTVTDVNQTEAFFYRSCTLWSSVLWKHILVVR